MTLKDSILGKLRREAKSVHSGELERFSMECGYKAETGGRVLRKLEEDGIISKDYDKKGCVWYRSKSVPTSSVISEGRGTPESRPTKIEFGNKELIHNIKYGGKRR